MGELSLGVNWIAVAVATIASFGLGAIWYSPILFQKPWLEGIGVSADDNDSAALPMLMQFIGTFLLAWLVGLFAARAALATTILVGLTIAFLLAAGGLFARKSLQAVVIEVAFVAAMLMIMITTHALI